MEHKSFSLGEFKALGEDDESGTFEAIVAVFGNVDAGGDIVHKGAFKRSLKEWASKGRSVPILWSHDSETPPIGVVQQAAESNEGLRIKGRLLVDDNPHAKAVYAAMKAGALHEFSFGYAARGFKHRMTVTGQKVRDLLDIDLDEISPVWKGMNPKTRLMGVKSAEIPAEIADIEAKIADLEGQKAALEAAQELPTDVTDDVTAAPVEGVEPDDKPEPKTTTVEEALARIRRLQAEQPIHLETESP